MTLYKPTVAVGAYYAVLGLTLLTPMSAPAWIRYTEASILIVPFGAIVLAIFVSVIRDRISKPAVREVPISNGIQVLGTFLGDEDGGANR